MKLLLLPGDGIGPEISEATRSVLESARSRFGFPLEVQPDEIGFPSLERHGTTIRDDLIAVANHTSQGRTNRDTRNIVSLSSFGIDGLHCHRQEEVGFHSQKF